VVIILKRRNLYRSW